MKLVYHGSPFLFTNFDYTKMGYHGTSEGFGFYFADRVRPTLAYAFSQSGNPKGYVYVAEFLGRKVLSDVKLTITPSQLRNLLTVLDRQGEYLSNYGDVSYEGYFRVLNRAVVSLYEHSGSDVDLVGDLINSFGSAQAVLQTLHKLLGYDHVKPKTDWARGFRVYVMLVPEAFRLLEVREYYRDALSTRKYRVVTKFSN